MVGFVAALTARITGGEPDDLAEQGVRLILSLLAGYPLAFVYRNLFHGKPANLQHMYFTLCGLLLCYFNFGEAVIHSVINITVIWLLLQFAGGTGLSVALAFIFNTLYLVLGYMSVMTDDYNISWATPHCVITLRLTGVVFDVFDGKTEKEKSSDDQNATALQSSPTLLEMMGHTYHFGGFLVGPQFNMRRYQSLVKGSFSDSHTGGPPHNVSMALFRCMVGLGYIAVFQVFCGSLFEEDYMLTEQFKNLGFLTKCSYIAIWGKLAICKYVGCWLIAEGSCMLTGLTYNGKDINGNTLWDGCTNVKVQCLETSSTFREMIAGFNVNTNMWMHKYIFKRLRFLGSKELSQAVTLLYLSVWHGLHSGYYMNFFLEFVMLYGETQVASVLQRLPGLLRWCQADVIRSLVWLIKKMLVLFFFGYALVSFSTMKWNKYMQVYSSVSYVGHVVFFLLPILCFLLKLVIPRPGTPTTNDVNKARTAVNDVKKTS